MISWQWLMGSANGRPRLQLSVQQSEPRHGYIGMLDCECSTLWWKSPKFPFFFFLPFLPYFAIFDPSTPSVPQNLRYLSILKRLLSHPNAVVIVLGRSPEILWNLCHGRKPTRLDMSFCGFAQLALPWTVLASQAAGIGMCQATGHSSLLDQVKGMPKWF